MKKIQTNLRLRALMLPLSRGEVITMHSGLYAAVTGLKTVCLYFARCRSQNKSMVSALNDFVLGSWWSGEAYNDAAENV